MPRKPRQQKPGVTSEVFSSISETGCCFCWVPYLRSPLFPGEPPFCSRMQVRTRPALGFDLGDFGPPGQQYAWAPVSSSCLNCVEVDRLMFMCWAESRPITVSKLFYRAHVRKSVSTEMVVEGFLLPLLALTDTTLLKFYFQSSKSSKSLKQQLHDTKSTKMESVSLLC